MLVATHDPILALMCSQRLVIKNRAVVSIVQTTSLEWNTHSLTWGGLIMSSIRCAKISEPADKSKNSANEMPLYMRNVFTPPISRRVKISGMIYTASDAMLASDYVRSETIHTYHFACRTLRSKKLEKFI